jgi:hypothetical protein
VTAAETESTCRILDELDLCRDADAESRVDPVKERIPLVELLFDERIAEIPPDDGLYTIECTWNACEYRLGICL